LKRETLESLRAARRERRSIALVTELGTGSQHIADAGQARTGVEPAGNDELFTHVFQPTPRLIVVGAVHIAQKLVPLARLADFTVMSSIRVPPSPPLSDFPMSACRVTGRTRRWPPCCRIPRPLS
jgi:xanthine/CO dehydrogenase XdhC/CoxF family maturation factor